MNKNVDFFFEKEKSGRRSLNFLRSIILECGNRRGEMGAGCYTLEKSNIVLIWI